MSDKDLANAIPDMIVRTAAGKLAWVTTDGASFDSPSAPGERPQHLRLWREGKEYVLQHTMKDYSATVRQNDFLWRCKLAGLWDEASRHATRGAPPVAVAPVDHPLADEVAGVAWTTPGKLRERTEPLNEKTWLTHLAGGRPCDEALVGPYRLRLLDVRSLGANEPVRYSYRLFALRELNGVAVIAVNHESFPSLGTSSFGVHAGAIHLNCGRAPAEVSLEVFRARALELLREQLLALRRAGVRSKPTAKTPRTPRKRHRVTAFFLLFLAALASWWFAHLTRVS